MGGIYPERQLQGLAITTDHQPAPSMEDHLCKGRVVVLQHGLSLSHGVKGFPSWCRPMSDPTCVLPGATLPELQSNLRWLLFLLGLEIPRQSQAVNLGQLLLLLGPGPLSKRYGNWGLTEASCCLFERV